MEIMMRYVFLYLFIKRTLMTFSPLSFRVGTNAKGLLQIHSCFVIFVQKHSWRQCSRGAKNLSPPMNGTFGYAFVAMMKTVTIIFASSIHMWNWYQRLCMALVYILSVPLCLTHARDMSKTQPSKKYNLSNLSIWPLSQLQTFTCRNGRFCLYICILFASWCWQPPTKLFEKISSCLRLLEIWWACNKAHINLISLQKKCSSLQGR